MKKVLIGGKPSTKSTPTSPDDWVVDRSNADEPTKRLTIDIPLSLHQRVKSQCALKGEKMADVVRNLLTTHFDKEREPVIPVVVGETPMQKHDSVTFSNYDGDQTGK